MTDFYEAAKAKLMKDLKAQNMEPTECKEFRHPTVKADMWEVTLVDGRTALLGVALKLYGITGVDE